MQRCHRSREVSERKNSCAVTAGTWQVWHNHFRHTVLDFQVCVCSTGLTLEVSALFIVELICVCSPFGLASSQSVLGLGASWPRQHLGLGAMAFFAGGLWQGNYFGGFGVAGFHQVVFIEWDTELIILALLSHTNCWYLNGFSWEDVVPSSCSQITKAHSVSAGVLAFLNRVNVM